ncbi:MAG: radical SAM family RiPP maturation amino acid epimerase [Lachnospiraceae bacterium]|nr:radical SAM family RiPP maturation amino acid epimerase [Lachnospiraceae bacterium]
MNEHEKKLACMTREQMGEEEYKRIKILTGNMKRVADLMTCIPGAIEEFEEDTEGFLKKYSLESLDAKEMRLIFLSEDNEYKAKLFKSEDVLDRISESMFRYAQFVQNKLLFRDFLRDKGCAPSNKTVSIWRDRNNKRCDSALGGVNISFIHAILTIELAEGCSVGCDFCGLGAERLKAVFRYTDENAALFKGVLKVLHEVLGDAAGFGMMYFATEPLDNPDYEKFEEDYFNEFHMLPQITTAVFDRNIERTRYFVHELDEKQGFIHRFSLRSLEMAKTALKEFTPEEMVNVELITQYEESPYFLPYTVVGSEIENKDKRKKTRKNARLLDEALAETLDAPVLKNEIKRLKGLKHVDPGTICCVDGFRVNMCKKTINILTPCHQNEKYPNGISETKEVSFNDENDFRDKLLLLIDEYMKENVPDEEALELYDYLRLEKSKEGIFLISDISGYRLPIDKYDKRDIEENRPNMAVNLVEKLLRGVYNKNQLVKAVMSETGAPPENIYWLINQLWKQGLIKDTKFF